MLKRAKVIQIVGQSRSGKDWLADKLKNVLEKEGLDVEIFHYADPLKEMVAATFNISIEELEEFKNNPDKAEILLDIADKNNNNILTVDRKKYTFREILQRLATEGIRNSVKEDFFIEHMRKRINKSKADVVIIPDCRFPNEASEIGGYIIKVIANKNTKKDEHISENLIDDIKADVVVDNTGNRLKQEDVEKIAEEFMKEKLNRLKKKIIKVFNRYYFLLGEDKNGERYWLEEPEWACDWYWGFGSIEQFNASFSDIKMHTHADFFINWWIEWNGQEPVLTKTTFNEKEGWVLSELFKRFYIFKEMAEYHHLGSANIVQKCGISSFADKEEGLRINKEIIPTIMQKIIEILTPKEKAELVISRLKDEIKKIKGGENE